MSPAPKSGSNSGNGGGRPQRAGGPPPSQRTSSPSLARSLSRAPQRRQALPIAEQAEPSESSESPATDSSRAGPSSKGDQTTSSQPEGSQTTSFSHSTLGKLETELAETVARRRALPADVPASMDRIGLTLWVLCMAAFISTAALANRNFFAGETGLGLLFGSLVVVSLSLAVFAGVRAFAPLWRLATEWLALRVREQEIVTELERFGPAPVIEPKPRTTLGGRRLRVPKATIDPRIAEQLPSGRSPSGWRDPRAGAPARIKVRRIGWTAAVVTGLMLVLFVAGVIMGARGR